MESLLVAAMLLVLFVMGMQSMAAFRDTAYARGLQTLFASGYRMLFRNVLAGWLLSAANNLLVLFCLIGSAALPGGAMWIAPWAGLHAAIMGASMQATEPAGRFSIPRPIFVTMFLLAFVLEAGVLAYVAVQATVPAMNWQFALVRVRVLWQQVQPVAAGMVVLAALVEAILAQSTTFSQMREASRQAEIDEE